MFKLNKVIFMNFLIMGTLIAISSYSWMSMWMGLEINLLSIIPLMSSNKNMYASEAALKYFITQALASIILLFSIIMMSMELEFIPQNSNEFLNMIMNSSFLTKMGAAPFHFWFPEIMEGLNWFNSFLMLTWQKIAPMILIMYNLKFSLFIFMVIIISMITSGLMGLNQTSMRKILTFSSINHIGWMLSSMLINQTVWGYYFIIYTIISLNIILIFHSLNIFYIQQLYTNLNTNKTMKMFFILNFLSLGGLPPFLGFFPKWITVNYLMNENLYLLSLLMIIFTLITLFFYLRITFNSLMLNISETLMINVKINSFLIFFSNLVSLMSLIFCTLVFNFA